MKKHVLTFVVAVIIGVSLILYLFAFQVRQNELAVLLRFGKAAEKLPEPGYHFKWPWPIEEVRTFDGRINVNEGRIEETLTRDRHNINISLCVGWQLSDALKFNENFGRAEPENRARDVWGAVETYIRDAALSTLGQHDLGELVSTDPARLKFDEIEKEIIDSANLKSVPIRGVKFVLVKLRRLELPESVTNVVYDRMRSERNKESNAISRSGEGAAAVIRGNADSEKQQILARAKSEAERLRGEGDAEAARYYSEFAKNPDLAIFLFEVQALREAAKSKTTFILDTNTPPFTLLKKEPPAFKPTVTVGAQSASQKPAN